MDPTHLFELVIVMFVAIIALHYAARSFGLPPSAALLAGGATLAFIPGLPTITVDPGLVLVIFLPPLLMDGAWSIALTRLRRHMIGIASLAIGAVFFTCVVVAVVAHLLFPSLPWAACAALGAIVSPPDAVSARAVLERVKLPRRLQILLEGESLLNDAVALLLFVGAVRAASAESVQAIIPALALAVPGGIILGIAAGRARVPLYARMVGTQRGTLFEFVLTFGVWIIAERLHLSPVLAVVAFAMTVARYMPERQTPGDRVQSYAVWTSMGFLLNVLAFLLMGLQARIIVQHLSSEKVWMALGFALLVLAIVILVRIAWVLLYRGIWGLLTPPDQRKTVPPVRSAFVVSWAGMRGLITLATALGLPADFPGRDLIVLTALTVVLGTLILQGFTLGPLIRFLSLKPDHSLAREVAATRLALIESAIDSLRHRQDEAACRLREHYRQERAFAQKGLHPLEVTLFDHLRRRALIAKRRKLLQLRRSGAIDEDVFHRIEQELDWAELAASAPGRFELLEG